MDLSETHRNLKALEARLRDQNAPARARFERLGPRGLFELAAAEQLEADCATDPDERRLHRVAARAAQTMAERLVDAGA